MLQARYVEHCKRRGWDFVNTAPKVAVNHIIAGPPALKSRIEDAFSTGEEPSQRRLLRVLSIPGRASRDLRVVPPASLVPRDTEGRPREEF